MKAIGLAVGVDDARSTVRAAAVWDLPGAATAELTVIAILAMARNSPISIRNPAAINVAMPLMYGASMLSLYAYYPD